MESLLKAFTEILKLLQDPVHLIFVLTVLILFTIIWWMFKTVDKQNDFCIKLSGEVKDLSVANKEIVTLIKVLVSRG